MSSSDKLNINSTKIDEFTLPSENLNDKFKDLLNSIKEADIKLRKVIESCDFLNLKVSTSILKYENMKKGEN